MAHSFGTLLLICLSTLFVQLLSTTTELSDDVVNCVPTSAVINADSCDALSRLRKTTWIEYLNVKCGLHEWSDLTFPNLRSLIWQTNNSESRLESSSAFANLTSLYLSYTSRDPPTNLNYSHIGNLFILNLSGNDLKSINNLIIPSSLAVLDLASNCIKNFSVPPQLTPSLTSLNYSSNCIQYVRNVTCPASLRSLDLSNNAIAILGDIFIQAKSLNHLSLRSNNISIISKSAFRSLASLEVLDLSQNAIVNFNASTFFPLLALIRLNLHNNRLESLGEQSFAGLNRLQSLDISDNHVVSLAPGTFQYLTSLSYLLLSNNLHLGGKLESVDDFALILGTGQKLQMVDVSRTTLTKIPALLTRSVRNLQLSMNPISSLHCGDLDSYPLLQILNLTLNNITMIEDDALGRLELLTSLILTSNALQTVPQSLPDNLSMLDLDVNAIQQLKSNDFQALPRLTKLSLRWNLIASIDDGAFGQLSSLEFLDLTGNPIKLLSINTFVGPRRLKILILSNLTEIIPSTEPLSFPVPESARYLEKFDLSRSPMLVNQLMNDIAALKSFRHLSSLNLADSNITALPIDLPTFLPRLNMIILSGNPLNCTNLEWLTMWLRRLEDSGITQDTLDRNPPTSSPISYNKFERTRPPQLPIALCPDVNKQLGSSTETDFENGPTCTTPINMVGRFVKDLPLTLPLQELQSPTSRISLSDTPPQSASTPQSLQPTSTPQRNTANSMTTPLPLSTSPSSATASVPPDLHARYELKLSNVAQDKTENTSDEIIQNVSTTDIVRTLLLFDMKNTSKILYPIPPVPAILPIDKYKKGTFNKVKPHVSYPIFSPETKPKTDVKLTQTVALTTTMHDTQQLKDQVLANKSINVKSVFDRQLDHFTPQTLSKTNSNSPFSVITVNETNDRTRSSELGRLHSSLSPSSYKTDAYSSRLPPLDSHPGMFVFLIILSMLITASMGLTWSHCLRRRQVERGYTPQQDLIEVRSLSNDLW